MSSNVPVQILYRSGSCTKFVQDRFLYFQDAAYKIYPARSSSRLGVYKGCSARKKINYRTKKFYYRIASILLWKRQNVDYLSFMIVFFSEIFRFMWTLETVKKLFIARVRMKYFGCVILTDILFMLYFHLCIKSRLDKNSIQGIKLRYFFDHLSWFWYQCTAVHCAQISFKILIRK